MKPSPRRSLIPSSSSRRVFVGMVEQRGGTRRDEDVNNKLQHIIDTFNAFVDTWVSYGEQAMACELVWCDILEVLEGACPWISS